MNTTARRIRAASSGATPADNGAGQPVISCTNIARTFGTGAQAVVAVYNVTLTVAGNARAALTGPSGSGKSTLLHLFAGLESPSAGELRWPALGGHPLDEPGRVGMIFQGPSLLPALTVAENVILPLQLAGADLASARQASENALAVLGIAELASSLPEEISGGQAQRVAIARAVASGPSLILADEPTGQLDRATASLVMDVLLQACDALGAALIVSTHDPLIAGRLPQRWEMSDGTLADRLGPSSIGAPR
jgi:ABC-type lipoprotein export system ATPase subunit